MSITLTHDGLPEGKTRADVVKLVGEAGEVVFCFSAKTIKLLRHYVDRCWEADFQRGRICGTWEQPHTTAALLGISTRALSYKEQELEDAGLILRTGVRHANRAGKRTGDRIDYCAGIILAPLIERFDEIHEMLAIERQRIDQGPLLRLQIAKSRALIRASGDAELIAQSDALTGGGRTKRITDIDRLTQIKASIDALVVQTQLRSGAQFTSDRSEADFAPNIPWEESQESTGTWRLRDLGTENLDSITPAAAIRLASDELRSDLSAIGEPSWPNLTEACRRTGRRIGISQWVWGDACSRLGKVRATLCVLAIDRNHKLPGDHPFHCRRPSGALFMMARKAGPGLNLNGLLRAIQGYPEDAGGEAASDSARLAPAPLQGVTQLGSSTSRILARIKIAKPGERP